MNMQFLNIAELVNMTNGSMNLQTLRPVFQKNAAGVLREEDWEQVDRAVVESAQTRLRIVSDMVSANMVARAEAGLGVVLSSWDKESDMTDADIDMSGIAEGERDRLTYERDSVPVPIIHKDFTIHLRNLLSSRRNGEPLDVASSRVAGRKVAETVEKMIVNGTGGPTVGGFTLQGLTNHSDRITSTAAGLGGGDFGTAGNGRKTLQGAIAAFQAISYYGPFMMYVPAAQFMELLQPVSANGEKSELTYMKEEFSEYIRDIRPLYSLTAGTCAMAQWTPDVMDLFFAEDITTLQWMQNPMLTQYKVLMAVAPRFKVNANGDLAVQTITGC